MYLTSIWNIHFSIILLPNMAFFHPHYNFRVNQMLTFAWKFKNLDFAQFEYLSKHFRVSKAEIPKSLKIRDSSICLCIFSPLVASKTWSLKMQFSSLQICHNVNGSGLLRINERWLISQCLNTRLTMCGGL